MKSHTFWAHRRKLGYVLKDGNWRLFKGRCGASSSPLLNDGSGVVTGCKSWVDPSERR